MLDSDAEWARLAKVVGLDGDDLGTLYARLERVDEIEIAVARWERAPRTALTFPPSSRSLASRLFRVNDFGEYPPRSARCFIAIHSVAPLLILRWDRGCTSGAAFGVSDARRATTVLDPPSGSGQRVGPGTTSRAVPRRTGKSWRGGWCFHVICALLGRRGSLRAPDS